MENTTLNGFPALKETMEMNGATASITIGYINEEARTNAKTLPNKQDLIKALNMLPSFQVGGPRFN